MDSYKVLDKCEAYFDLNGGEGLKPPSSGDTGFREEKKAKLSQIIHDLNSAPDFTDDDRVFLEMVKTTSWAMKNLLKRWNIILLRMCGLFLINISTRK